MNSINAKKVIVILVHAFVGWVLCAAVINIGMAVLPLETTLIIHAIAAPIIFAALSWIYFSKFKYTAPLHTAIAFVAVVMLMDFFVVALLIERSFDMFRSAIGTWIPFALIFLSTYLMGLYVERRS